MTRSRRLLLTVLLVAATTAALVFYRPVRDWLAIDACLDNGDRWDYARHNCDHGP